MTGKLKLKQAVYSWNRSRVRRVLFKPGSKLGIVLGKNCTIIKVRWNTQAFWKGLKVGSTILKINGMDCEDISIKSELKEVVKSSTPFVIVLKVPNLPGNPEKKPESQKEGSPNVSLSLNSGKGPSKEFSSTLSSSGDFILVDDSESMPVALPAQMKGIHENADSVTSGTSLCSVEGNKEPDFTILQDKIKELQQANLELQQKYSAEVMKRKDECMKKDSKITRLERQVSTLQSERNSLRKQIIKMKTQEKQNSDHDTTLKVISECKINSPYSGIFTFKKRGQAKRISCLSTAESMQSVDVWYGNPAKDTIQAMWKESKKKAGQILSFASSRFGIPSAFRSRSLGSPTFTSALEAPLHNSSFKSALDDSEIYTDYTDSSRTEVCIQSEINRCLPGIGKDSTDKNRLSVLSAVEDEVQVIALGGDDC